MDEQVRKIVALACEYRASVDVVFEKDGDVRIAIYPAEVPETKVVSSIKFEEPTDLHD